MHSSLQLNQFFVKEHAGPHEASNNYDIFDPATKQKILECREHSLGIFTKLFRFTEYKQLTPFNIEVRTPEGAKVLPLSGAFRSFFRRLSFWTRTIES
jgi:hypothetical protein